MKFGSHLQDNLFPPWRLSYFSYNRLKQELKRRTLDHLWSQTDEEEFIQLIENELTQVQDFINAKISDIESRIIYCERSIQDVSVQKETLADLLFDHNLLYKFIRLNHTALQKILKKHDRWAGLTELKTRFISNSRALDTQRLYPLLAHIRALQNQSVSAEVYWIQPEDLPQASSDILLQAAKIFEGTISCVYLDTADFKYYTSIVQNECDADYIRLRWQEDDTTEVLVENKQNTLLKLTQDQAASYLSGQNNLPYQDLQHLQPVLKTTFYRTTFSLPGNAETHLDTDITFYHANNSYTFSQATLGPHNLDLVTLRPVPHFSKYTHGVSHFYQMPLVPWWFYPQSKQTDQQQPTRIQPSDESEPLLPQEKKEEKLLAQIIPDQDLEVGKPEIQVKLDSKTFFSNERTFISWLQFSALLLSASINLLNFGDSTSRIAGGVFVGIAAGVALYSLYRFEKRAWMIGHRSIGRYHDIWGPAGLCAILVGALIVNIYLRFR